MCLRQRYPGNAESQTRKFRLYGRLSVKPGSICVKSGGIGGTLTRQTRAGAVIVLGSPDRPNLAAHDLVLIAEVAEPVRGGSSTSLRVARPAKFGRSWSGASKSESQRLSADIWPRKVRFGPCNRTARPRSPRQRWYRRGRLGMGQGRALPPDP